MAGSTGSTGSTGFGDDSGIVFGFRVYLRLVFASCTIGSTTTGATVSTTTGASSPTMLTLGFRTLGFGGVLFNFLVFLISVSSASNSSVSMSAAVSGISTDAGCSTARVVLSGASEGVPDSATGKFQSTVDMFDITIKYFSEQKIIIIRN